MHVSAASDGFVGELLTTRLVLQYVDLRDQQAEIQDWFQELCAALSLVGRVRVAEDGINVTVRFFLFVNCMLCSAASSAMKKLHVVVHDRTV